VVVGIDSIIIISCYLLQALFMTDMTIPAGHKFIGYKDIRGKKAPLFANKITINTYLKTLLHFSLPVYSLITN